MPAALCCMTGAGRAKRKMRAMGTGQERIKENGGSGWQHGRADKIDRASKAAMSLTLYARHM